MIFRLRPSKGEDAIFYVKISQMMMKSTVTICLIGKRNTDIPDFCYFLVACIAVNLLNKAR